jgi:DNA-binding MarR family transcriptional regulator
MPKKKIIDLFKEGYTIKEISEIIKYTRGYVGKILSKSEEIDQL